MLKAITCLQITPGKGFAMKMEQTKNTVHIRGKITWQGYFDHSIVFKISFFIRSWEDSQPEKRLQTTSSIMKDVDTTMQDGREAESRKDPYEEEDMDVSKTPCSVMESDSAPAKDLTEQEEEVDTDSQPTVRSLHEEKRKEEMQLDTEDGGSSSSSEDSSEDSRLVSSSSQASSKSHKEGEVEEEEDQMDKEGPRQTMVSSPSIARGHVDARLSSLEDAVSQQPDEVSQGQVVSSLEKTGSQEEEMDFENSQVEEVQNIQDEEVENREGRAVAADDQEEVAGIQGREGSRNKKMDFGSQTEEVQSSQEEEVENREEETVDNGQDELVGEQGGEGSRRKSRRLQEAEERTQEDTSSGGDFFDQEVPKDKTKQEERHKQFVEEIKEWREKENEKVAQKRYEQELKETASQKRGKQRKIAAEKRASESQEEEEEGGSAKKKAGRNVKNASQLSEENERVLNMFKHGNQVSYLFL